MFFALNVTHVTVESPKTGEVTYVWPIYGKMH